MCWKFILCYICLHVLHVQKHNTRNGNFQSFHFVVAQQNSIAACIGDKNPKEMYNRTGIILSPGYPDTGPTYIHCSWYIYVEGATEVGNTKIPFNITLVNSTAQAHLFILNWEKVFLSIFPYNGLRLTSWESIAHSKIFCPFFRDYF